MTDSPSEFSSRSNQNYSTLSSVSPSYIPHMKYLKLEQANLLAIIGKTNSFLHSVYIKKKIVL